MLVFDYTDFIQNATGIFNAALADEVIVNTKDGNRFKILPVQSETNIGKSPLEDIPCIEAEITTQEIVELLRESRAGI
jgi:hypothetical protein